MDKLHGHEIVTSLKFFYSKAPKLFDYELLAPQNYQKSEDIPSSHTFLPIVMMHQSQHTLYIGEQTLKCEYFLYNSQIF